MREIIDLPILGTVRRSAEISYRATEPVSLDDVRDLIRAKWCDSVQVRDGSGHNEFRAVCVIDGHTVTVSGEIGGR